MAVILLSPDDVLFNQLRVWLTAPDFLLHPVRTTEDLMTTLENRSNTSLVLLGADPDAAGDACRRIRELRDRQTLPVLLMLDSFAHCNPAQLASCGFSDVLSTLATREETVLRITLHCQRQAELKAAIAEEIKDHQPRFKPHFIFNALSVIISLCYDEGPRAGMLLTEFSNYLRLTYSSDADRMDIPLEKELSLIRSYVAIEKARFGERVDIQYHIDESTLDCQIPALILQPLIEYAIRRGILKRMEGGCVQLFTRLSNGRLDCQVQDNGPGGEEDSLQELMRPGESTEDPLLQNVRYRLKAHYHQELLIERQPGIGTQISFSIPIR